MTYLKRFITKRKVWLKSQLISERSLILIYHKISNEAKEIDPYSLTVSPDNFSEHLNILKRYFNVISLPELLLRIKNKELLQKSVVITFDDGYLDNLTFAKPLLEKYQIPAAVFITTGYLGKMFWWDLLISHILDLKSNTNIVLNGNMFRLNTNPKELEKCLNEITYYFRSLTYQEKIEFVNEVYFVAHQSNRRDLSRSMTKEEIAKFSNSRFIEIGGHTVQHFPLSSLNEKEQCNEILANKFDLENIIQKEVNLFAYPHSDYDSFTIDILNNNSFHCGATGPLGVIHNDSDPYQLNRLSVQNWNKNTFKLFLQYWL